MAMGKRGGWHHAAGHASLVFLLASSVAQAETRVALVIGNSAYKHAGVPATRSPRLAGQSWAAHEAIQGH